MPTKINSLSPFTLDPATIISLGIKQKQGQQEAVQDYAKQVRQDLGIEEGQKGIFGGLLRSDEFKDLSLGKKLGIYGKGLFHSAVGGIEGVTGMDLLKNDNEGPELSEQPTYRTNIDPVTGEEILPNQDLVNKYGIPMAGKPIKALTQMHGTVAHNMSAAQYNKALQMKEISGAATMMTADQAKMVKALESDSIPENDIVAEKIKNK